MSVESIRRELWMGEIPVCFTLDPDDLASIVEEPEPYCRTVPRYELRNYKERFSEGSGYNILVLCHS